MTTPTEVAGLPIGGPATLPAVKIALGIPAADERDDALIEQWIPAVNRIVRTLPKAAESAAPDTEPEDRTWQPDLEAGAVMLVARLVRRKASPSGVEAIGQSGAVVYVMRNDPDISMMLGIGAWGRPAVG